jgi:hypothetical protein
LGENSPNLVTLLGSYGAVDSEMIGKKKMKKKYFIDGQNAHTWGRCCDNNFFAIFANFRRT